MRTNRRFGLVGAGFRVNMLSAFAPRNTCSDCLPSPKAATVHALKIRAPAKFCGRLFWKHLAQCSGAIKPCETNLSLVNLTPL